jgi:hypothetical protein
MSEIILAKIVQTCLACPEQWDAWDVDGNYWYLRYRHGRGSAERQPTADIATWDDKVPNISFDGAALGEPDGYIGLTNFCRHAGLNIHPQAEIWLYEDSV